MIKTCLKAPHVDAAELKYVYTVSCQCDKMARGIHNAVYVLLNVDKF